MYCTVLQLLDVLGARELAQVATPERARVIADTLMEATLRGTDRSAFDPVEVGIADEALVRIEQALNGADQVIDGFLRTRKPVPYVVPLNPVPGLVSVWARQIARYSLHKDRSSSEGQDPIVRDYKDAQKFLAQVAAGTFSLGSDDPQPPDGGGAAAIYEPPRAFPEGSLNDFTQGYGT